MCKKRNDVRYYHFMEVLWGVVKQNIVYSCSLNQSYNTGKYGMIVCECVMYEARQAVSEAVPLSWRRVSKSR
jgi:hypothetical protein